MNYSKNPCVFKLNIYKRVLIPNGLIVIGLTNNDPYIALHECTHAVFALKEIIG